MRVKIGCFSLLFYCLVCLTPDCLYAQESDNIYITNSLAGGRFGDKFFGYVKARWVAYITDTPFVLTPCQYFDHLMLHDNDVKIHDLERGSTRFNRIKKDDFFLCEKSKLKNNTIYSVGYKAVFKKKGASGANKSLRLAKKDPVFVEKMRQSIQLKTGRNSIIMPPKGCKTVALHVRTGGGYDRPLWSIQYYDKKTLQRESKKEYNRAALRSLHLDVSHPGKAIPQQFYVDRLNEIALLYPEEKFYVHLFTDHRCPEEIINRLKVRMRYPDRFAFHCRKENSHNTNVVEDILSMGNFDILIRPNSSHFSCMADFLGKHELVVSPKKYVWKGRCLVVTEARYDWR